MLFKNSKTGNVLAVTDKTTIDLMTKKGSIYTAYKPPKTKSPTEGKDKNDK